MKYNKLNELLSKCLVCGETQAELVLRYFHFPLRDRWELTYTQNHWYIESKIVQDLAKEVQKLDLLDTFTPIGIDAKGNFRTEVLVDYNYVNPPRYIFRVTPLNNFEKLTKLAESFEAEDDQISENPLSFRQESLPTLES